MSFRRVFEEESLRIGKTVEIPHNEHFPHDVIADLISQLKLLNVIPIYLGSWKYLLDNTFQKLVVEKIT